MSARFVVRDRIDENDARGHLLVGYELYDTLKGVVVGTDHCEPEDAILYRHFKWVVTAMNKLADEIERAA